MSKRGMRGMSMRVRVAVAATVLAGSGAAGVVALSASHSGTVNAQSAGFIQSGSHRMSYTSAISSAMKTWDTSPSTSLRTLTHMQQINNYWVQPWHHHTLFFQRGRVVAVGRNAIVVRSANGKLELWHINGKTAILNVGGTSMGMSAMTGCSVNMRVPSWLTMDVNTKRLAKGDLVFVFGELQHHTLKAQLVLFAAPMVKAPLATATPTPTMTMTTTAPAVAPTAVNVPTAAGTHF